MEEIKILVFVLSSFFGMENNKIAAEKTTVTIYPEAKEIGIVQEDLFSVIQSKEDVAVVLKQWDSLINMKSNEITLSKELDAFTVKNFTLKSLKDSIQPHLTLTYKDEKDLKALGIWYNPEKKQFSVNHVPKEHLKTKDGKHEGNYWVFSNDSTLTYTIEPFVQMPEKYKPFKKTLKTLLAERSKK